MIVLDTQHVSQLQRTGSKDAVKLAARLQALPFAEARITVISPFEQLTTCFGRINSARRALDQVPEFGLLLRLLDYFATRWHGRILPFDRAAASIVQGFEPKLLRRIGARDARIAAIAIVHGATLLSANLRDFQQVPGLKVEDWLREPAGP